LSLLKRGEVGAFLVGLPLSHSLDSSREDLLIRPLSPEHPLENRDLFRRSFPSLGQFLILIRLFRIILSWAPEMKCSLKGDRKLPQKN
jgi:hypothetical protein